MTSPRFFTWRRWLPLLLVPLAFSSCDKAKQFIASKKAGKVETLNGVAPGGDADPQLAGQVDRTGEGVRFRKDLTYPTSLTVHLEEKAVWTGGVRISTSALGRESEAVAGTYETVTDWVINGAEASVRVEKSGPVQLPVSAAAEGQAVKPLPEIDGLASFSGKTLHLRKSAQGWVEQPARGERDFQELVWARAMTPQAATLFSEAGLLTRPRWFSSTRYWKTGDVLELKDDALDLLTAGRASGRVTLTFEEVEAIGGHPVGRFSMTGQMTIAGAPLIEGNKAAVTRTISSGKIWCSLLYPVILREEYEAVETVDRGGESGPSSKLQGGVKIMRSRDLKMVAKEQSN